MTKPTPTPKITPTPAPTLAPSEEAYTIEGESYVLPTLADLEKERTGLSRNYPKTIKSAFDPGPTIGHRLIAKSLPELKDLGINTFNVIPYYEYVNGQLTLIAVKPVSIGLTGEKAEREYIDRIVKAKKAGFAVSIQPTFSGQQLKTSNLEAFDEFVMEQARKWAQLAEAYQVEYFSPINEYDKVLTALGLSAAEVTARMSKLHSEILAQVRLTFKGKIFLKTMTVQSASGFDIYAATRGFDGKEMPPLTEVSRIIRELLSDGQTVAKRDGLAWMVGEFFVMTGVLSEEQRVEIFKIAFEEYKKTLMGDNKPVGFTFFGWDMPDSKVKGTRIAPLLKQFFSEIDSVN